VYSRGDTNGCAWLVQVRVSEYNQLKGQVTQLNRKATGSLAVRELASVVDSADVVSTENLTTLFVVVNKHSLRDFLSCYETLVEFVVR
jgi:V-type H+-transporting ATPase subunit C